MCNTCLPGTCKVQKKVSDPLKLELQTVVSYPGSFKPNLVPLQELQMLLTNEPSLQYPFLVFKGNNNVVCFQDVFFRSLVWECSISVLLSYI